MGTPVHVLKAYAHANRVDPDEGYCDEDSSQNMFCDEDTTEKLVSALHIEICVVLLYCLHSIWLTAIFI